jgi:lipopolysaccharide/colanic/teichoic acid biosynthesis glycosyltransferase
MATTALLIDWRPAYLSGSRRATSLLLSPLGAATVLDTLRDSARAAGAQALFVLTTFECDAAYADAIHALAPDAALLTPHRFRELLESLEPSDWLLFLDTRHFPAGKFAARLRAEEAQHSALAIHLVHLRRECDGTQERVLCDEELHVRRIQRLYDGVTHLELAGVCAALVSATAARYLREAELVCLARLRARLSACGVPCRDIPAPCRELDLMQRADLLALNESAVLAATRGRLRPPFEERGPGIWVGPGCDLHRTSRLYGPVIIHQNVRIGPQAVVIGPAVLAAGAHVDQRGLVVQSLVGCGAHVTAGAAVVRDVLAPGANGDHQRTAHNGEEPGPPAFSAPVVDLHAGNGHDSPAAGIRARAGSARLKRALDFAVAACGLAALAPLLALVALLVKLTSRGPAFFGHLREGRGGKVFRCWKYRTMVDNAHARQRALYQANAVDGPQFKLPDDPRVTGLGDWLRTTNIDELPQLVNVLRGEMSLIGPRPSPFRENQICVPWRNARLSVRPGITGLWQVCRHERSAGDFHQWIWFDTLYVRHWSLGLDMRILLATFLTLGGRWSVPLTRMIPGRKLQQRAVPMSGWAPPPTTMAAAPPARSPARTRRRRVPSA